MSELRLTIELVPRSSWYNNLRKSLAPTDWDSIRKQTYAQFDHKCGICGASGKLNCHEIWRYDDLNHVQTLQGFIALCVMCHHVKHIGLAGILAGRGQLDYEAVVAHFMLVNGCDKNAFNAHRDEAFQVWKQRSAHSWRVELGQSSDLVKKYPRDAERA